MSTVTGHEDHRIVVTIVEVTNYAVVDGAIDPEIGEQQSGVPEDIYCQTCDKSVYSLYEFDGEFITPYENA